ncbi:hypothetical protein [Thermincola ferriacetica]|nr:hypothetical protein [Thermincola ferriacetica]
MSKSIQDLKNSIREKIIEIWKNPDNPPEDKLIEIFGFSAEQIINFINQEDD